jgi:L-fucose mutarotase
MLKGVSPLLSPELLKVMMEMGHGDELVLADANFPAASCAKRLVRADGQELVSLLEAILALFPLDDYICSPAAVMAVVPGDPVETPIWDRYRTALAAATGRVVELDTIERFAFYERARQAYAIVATGERALYANLMLRKGVL